MVPLIFNILYINKEDAAKEQKEVGYTREPIDIYINSSGGTLQDAWSLIDVMRISKTPVYTYCSGYAASAALLIFLAGRKRFMSERAYLLYHQMFVSEAGLYESMKENREFMDHMQEQIEYYVLGRTRVTKGQLETIRESKKDWHIYQEQALQLGFATDSLNKLW